MDIYDFISSKDVREHCVKIEHEFSPTDKIRLIAVNQDKTLDERIVAYRELAEEYRGLIIKPNRREDEEPQDLSLYIEKIIANELKFKEDMTRGGEGGVFTLNSRPYDAQHGIYKTYSDAIEALQTLLLHKRDENETYYICREKLGGGRELRNYIKITKTGEYIGAIDYVGEPEYPSELVYEDIYIPIPSPFKIGDIITDGKINTLSGGINIGVVHKLPEILEEDVHGRFFFNALECYIVRGNDIESDGFSPMQYLEYYREELPEDKKALKPISEYLKGNIYLCDLLNERRGDKLYKGAE
jgi:hypothetical protein